MDVRATWKAIFGTTGLGLWLLVFAAGMMITSKPFREAILARSPVHIATVQFVAADGFVDGVAGERVESPGDPAPQINWGNLFVSTLLFTPTNIALLTLLAGFIGGCTSNLVYARWAAKGEAPPGDAALHEMVERYRMLFLTESPLTSMLRSFVVYLGFIAGMYITTNDPFADGSAGQYARLAGATSILAFVVGYDPTKFQDLLSMIPGQGNRTAHGKP